MTPKVSVLMLAYNHEAFIEQAVRSVLQQKTSFDIEIVVGEDHSTDNTRAVLQHLAADNPGRLQLLFRPANLGMMRNLLDTYSACRGEYIAFLEGDDYWTDPNKLQKQADALDANASWSMCFHRVGYVDAAGVDMGKHFPETAKPESAFTDLIMSNFVQTCSVLLRRERVPELPEWFLDMPMGDWPLFLLAADTGPIGFLPASMACYRVHPGGVWTARNDCARFQAGQTVLAALDRHFQGKYAGEIKRSRDAAIRWLFDLIAELEQAWSLRLARALGYRTRRLWDWCRLPRKMDLT